MTPTPGRPAPALVSAMFGRIAPRYDLMNTVMTGGLDRHWRRAAVRAASPPADGLALDVGTGTARLAVSLAARMPRGRVIGLDFAFPMLRVGQAWLWHHELLRKVPLVAGDALHLPFAGGQFDCVASAFTIRNLPDLAAGIAEQARVLKPGGRMLCLELTWPVSRLTRAVFPLYFGRIVPLIGGLVSGDPGAYAYLPASVQEFPSPERLADIMRRAGLADIRWRRLVPGTVTLHVGSRLADTSPER